MFVFLPIPFDNRRLVQLYSAYSLDCCCRLMYTEHDIIFYHFDALLIALAEQFVGNFPYLI
eukprot:COSAG01_NODE_1777_length_9258_cov_7.865284_11_plen_61_part_00